MIRIYLLLGQFRIFSGGIWDLERRLSALSADIHCTVHGWRELQVIVDDIKSLPPDVLVVLIGHSLGGCSITEIAADVHRPIQLLVAYDASRYGQIKRIGENVEKTLCYVSTNYLFPWGHARLQGHNVRVFETPDNHFAIVSDSNLHLLTENAVKGLIS